MSEQTSQNASDEIDLGVVFEKIKSFFRSILIGIIQIFQFFWKHKFVLAGLLVIGGAVGYYVENNSEKVYKNEILIQPNFGSSDYLYSKVDILNLNIESKDSIFLQPVFGSEWRKVWKLEIKPIVDVFELISRSEKYKETFEMLLEQSGKISFVEEDPIITKAFKFHKLIFFNKGSGNGEILTDSLINFVNNNNYYNSIREIAIENTKRRIDQNMFSISQIDTIIEKTNNYGSNKFSSEGISFNSAQNLDDLLARKKLILFENRVLREDLNNFKNINKVVYVSSRTLFKDEFLMKNKMLVIPFILFLIYNLIFLTKMIVERSKQLIVKNNKQI
jgi:hypothetical protein